MSVADFVRAAVLRAACDTQGALAKLPDEETLDTLLDTPQTTASKPVTGSAPMLAVPGEPEQIVAQIQWGVEWDFKPAPKQQSAIWFKTSADEQLALNEMKSTLGAIVHGQKPADMIGLRLTDWLREHAWMTKANRVARKTGLSVVPFPPGSCGVEDGFLVLSMGPIAVRIALGEKNRKAYPGPGVFEDAALEQLAGGRWNLRYSAYKTSNPQKKTRPAK